MLTNADMTIYNKVFDTATDTQVYTHASATKIVIPMH